MGTLTKRFVREKIAPRQSPGEPEKVSHEEAKSRRDAAVRGSADRGRGDAQRDRRGGRGRRTEPVPVHLDHHPLADDHVVWRDPQTGQFLLAFSAGIKNLGAGTLNVVGYRDSVAGNLPNPNTMPAYQRLFHADGSCDELQIGTMTYHEVHHHWHLDGVMTYQLLDAKLKPVKPNSKVAFCLADVAVADSTLPGFPTAPAYNGCDPNARTTYVIMGTSVGWEDIYDKMLFGQNFDVTDLMTRPESSSSRTTPTTPRASG